MFQLFSTMSQGMFLADRAGRIVCVNEGYQRFLPDLAWPRWTTSWATWCEDVIPNTRMRRVPETGEPVLIDLLTNRAGTFVVSRIPLKDDAARSSVPSASCSSNQPDTTLQPLISKFAVLQRDLDGGPARAGRPAQPQPARGRAGRAPRQVQLCQLCRQQPGGPWSQAPGTPRGPVAQPRAAAGRNRHRQGAAGPCHPSGIARTGGPFVNRHIAAVPDALLEAEFFGVAPGAYTGADRKPRDGKFRLADGGTLFLDEIGDMPLNLAGQAAARAAEGEIEPLGSNQLVRFDVRVGQPPRATCRRCA